MGKFLGDQTKTLFKYESGLYAEPSGSGHWIGKVIENTPAEAENPIIIREQGTQDRSVSQIERGPPDYGGVVRYYPQDCKMLAFALGSCYDTGSPSPYSHEIREVNTDNGNYATSGTDAPFVSFTLEDSHFYSGGQNAIRTFKGCVVRSMVISSTMGEPVTCEINYLAQDVLFSSGAPTSVTAATTRPFLWNDCQIHLPSGTVLNYVTDWRFEINNNPEGHHYVNGSRVIQTPTMLNRDYTLTVTLHASSDKTKAIYDQYYRGGSEFNAMISMSASTGSRECFPVLSGCKIIDMGFPSPSEGVVDQVITIQPTNVSADVNELIMLYNAW